MQLGARWRAGEAPHRGVPPTLHSAIAEQEVAHPAASAWTLTFLEGRPRCALDDILTVTVTATGSVVVQLAAAADGSTLGAAPSGLLVSPIDDDEDDDWLS